MTIRHLRIFNEVAESGKMSIAASKFFISQPTVSQAIKELEDYYGVLLFERLSKKLYITDKGRYLLSYSKQVVEQFGYLESKMFENSKAEKIRVGSTITVGNTIMNELLKQYEEENESVELYSYVNNTKIIEEKLLLSELDLALVEGRIKSPDLVSIPVIKDHLVLACSSSHPFASKSSFIPQDLRNEKFVMREKGSGTRELFEQYLHKYGVMIQVSVEANCPSVIVRAILEQGCMGVISERLIEKEIANNEIIAIRNSECTWERSFSIVYHKNKFISKHMQNFINIIHNYGIE